MTAAVSHSQPVRTALRRAVAILALLASAPAMAQVAMHGDASNYSPGPRNVDPGPWRAPDPVVQQQYDAIAQKNAQPAIPADLLVIPQSWWTDQGNPEIACYHYDNGPYRDRLIDWCLAKVRSAK